MASVRTSASEAGQADMTALLEGLTILAENAQELKYQKADGNLLEAPGAPLLLETKLGTLKARLFWNVLATNNQTRIANHFQEMASVFAQSVFTVSIQCLSSLEPCTP